VYNLKQFVQIAVPVIHLSMADITLPIAAVKTIIIGLIMEPVLAMYLGIMFLLIIAAHHTTAIPS
jgi:hypothetical protein